MPCRVAANTRLLDDHPNSSSGIWQRVAIAPRPGWLASKGVQELVPEQVPELGHFRLSARPGGDNRP